MTDGQHFQSGVGKSTLIKTVFGVKEVVSLLLSATIPFVNNFC